MTTRELAVMVLVVGWLALVRWRRKRRGYECSYPAEPREYRVRAYTHTGMEVYTDAQGLVRLGPNQRLYEDEQGRQHAVTQEEYEQLQAQGPAGMEMAWEEVVGPYGEWVQRTGRRWSWQSEQEYQQLYAQQEQMRRQQERLMHPAVWMLQDFEALSTCSMTSMAPLPGRPGPAPVRIATADLYPVGPQPTKDWQKVKECPYCGTKQAYSETEKCKTCAGPWSRRKYT